MKWYRDLYLGAGIKKTRRQMIQKIEMNAGTPGVYLVTLAANGRDLFDIFSTDLLLQPVLHGHCPMIVGVAKGYGEAVDMATEIVMEAYRETGGFDVAEFLRSRVGAAKEMAYEYPMEKLKKRRGFGWKKADGR